MTELLLCFFLKKKDVQNVNYVSRDVRSVYQDITRLGMPGSALGAENMNIVGLL
jgi:hypothetical protein